MPSSPSGTSAALSGTGQVFVHLLPVRVTIGTRMPSPRRTAMVTAGRVGGLEHAEAARQAQRQRGDADDDGPHGRILH